MDISTCEILNINTNFIKLIDYVKNGHSTGSYDLAKRTALFIQEIISATNWSNIQQIIEQVQKIGKNLIKVDPTETVLGNVVKRILKLIRDEYTHSKDSNYEGFEVEELVPKRIATASNNSTELTAVVNMGNIKDSIIMAIGELLSELETTGGNIAQQALEHIYSDEVIMTIGHSKTVEAFLKYASKNKRKFQVIIVECAPFYHGHELAQSLAKEENISAILIPDSAIFSVMSRVNKVIIGAHSIMANGGIKAVSGAYTLALAAKHYSVPFIVCTGMYKLTPHYAIRYDQLVFNKFSSPEDIMSYKNSCATKCEITNPVFDYVPPELITIFVSNIGGNSPSYVYRLKSELYDPQDEFD